MGHLGLYVVSLITVPQERVVKVAEYRSSSATDSRLDTRMGHALAGAVANFGFIRLCVV